MMKSRLPLSFPLLLLFLLSFVLLTPSASDARTWHVRQDGSGDCTTIQACVDLAGQYDTVFVAPGTYTELVRLFNHLTLLSDAGSATTVITISSIYYPVVRIWDSTLDGFTIRAGDWVVQNECGGVRIYGGTLRNCVIVNGKSSAYDTPADAGGIAASGSCIIERNTIVSNGYFDIAGGIYCYSTFVGTIRQNIVALNKTAVAVYCEAGAAIAFTCNDVWGNPYGDYGGSCGQPTGTNGNISVDPLFCDAEHGDYRLRTGSPCLWTVGCGQMGAFGVGCGPTPTTETTWGKIKTLFR